MADGSHASTPLMAQHRSHSSQPQWSNASSSDLTAVGRTSQEKGLGSPLFSIAGSDEERIFATHEIPARRRNWLHKLVKLSALVILILLVHGILDGTAAPLSNFMKASDTVFAVIQHGRHPQKGSHTAVGDPQDWICLLPLVSTGPHCSRRSSHHSTISAISATALPLLLDSLQNRSLRDLHSVERISPRSFEMQFSTSSASRCTRLA